MEAVAIAFNRIPYERMALSIDVAAPNARGLRGSPCGPSLCLLIDGDERLADGWTGCRVAPVTHCGVIMRLAAGRNIAGTA